jgi:hypothetical protein
MCYERMFLKGWAKKKVQQRTEEERALKRTPPVRPVTQTAPDRAPERRKESEHELEEIV